MTQKTLVAYFSKGGATEVYADLVARVLKDKGHVVDVINLRRSKTPDLAEYQNVIVGTGVRLGMVYRRAKRFLKRQELREKRLAIFLSSGIAVDDADESKAKFLDPLIEKSGLKPVMCDALPGKTPGPGMDLEDTTDPKRAKQWATDLSVRLG